MTRNTYSYDVDFIPDLVLEEAVSELLDRAEAGRRQSNPYRNVIDPFAALFEASSLEGSLSEWLDTERTRQVNKSLTNAVGDFHQTLIAALPGWRSAGSVGGVVDLYHEGPFGVNQTPVLAEVKNKYNTMNSKNQEALYDSFQAILGWPEYRKSTCYLVQVIQKKPSGDVPWWPSKRAARDDIRRIGARQLYEESTGDPDAFEKVFLSVAKVLERKHNLTFEEADTSFITGLFKRAFG